MTIEVLPDLFKRAADGVVAGGGHGGPDSPPTRPTEGSLITQLSLLPRSAGERATLLQRSARLWDMWPSPPAACYFLMTSAVLGLVNWAPLPPAGSRGGSIFLAQEEAKVGAGLKL